MLFVLALFIFSSSSFSFSLSQRTDGELASLRDSYVSSLKSLEQENQQLRQDLAEVRARMEASNQMWQDKYERALMQSHNKNAHSHDRYSKQSNVHIY